MILADSLSHAYIKDCTNSQTNLEIELVCMEHMVLSNAPFTDTKLEEVSIATLEDTTMRLLQATIQNGWPDKISKTLGELRPFWRYRDELSEVVLKGLILQSLRSNMLNRIHSSHLGVIKCKERAKDVLFGLEWESNSRKQSLHVKMSRSPNVKHQITYNCRWAPFQIMANCCNRSLSLQRMWLPVTCWLFLKYLWNCKVTRHHCHTKSIFARHGIPNVLRSDHGLQFTSDEFKQFRSQCRVSHISVSPYHLQSNGLVEKYVQIIKRLLNKPVKTNQTLISAY